MSGHGGVESRAAERSLASAIILAGGRSERFGSDKLQVEIAGKPLLEHAIWAVSAVVDDVVLSVRPGSDRRELALSGLGPGTRVRIVADGEADGGPLVGLVAGLGAVERDLVLVAGGDMPTLRPAVLALLIQVLAGAGPEVGAVTLQSAGRTQPLPAALRASVARPAATRLMDGGPRSLRSLLAAMPTIVVDAASWRPLDPAGDSLRDIDVPADLRSER